MEAALEIDKPTTSDSSTFVPEAAPLCLYCGKLSALVTGATIYPRRPDLHGRYFWQCAPCDAYVGCHEADRGQGNGTRALGRLANAELRKAKMAVHAVFDPIWRQGKLSRKAAYAWLAEQMKMQVENCHVGMFTVADCRKAEEICRAFVAHKRAQPV